MAKPSLSIVLPVYRNRETLLPLHQQLCAVLEPLALDFEIIFVNDACTGGSLAILEKLAESDPHVAVLSLEKNVGQHQAALLGITYATGSHIVIMDADLQDPPEAIPKLLKEIDKGFATVFAGRRGKYESGARLLSSRLFKTTLHFLTGLPADAGMFMLITKKMRERILTMQGPAPFVVAMVGCAGLPVTSLPVLRVTREAGKSSYTFWTRLRSAWRAIYWIGVWRWQQIAAHLGIATPNYTSNHLSLDQVRFIGARFENQTTT